MTRAIKIFVLCLAGTFIALCYAQAATIIGSKHDLSNAGQEQVCIICHTPHNANPQLPGLWNRNVSADAMDFTFYSSATLTGRPSGKKPGVYTLLCLGCHTSILYKNYVAVNANDPHNLINGLQSTGWDDCEKCHTDGGFGAPREHFMVGPNLSNDHPISIPTLSTGTRSSKRPPTAKKGG